MRSPNIVHVHEWIACDGEGCHTRIDYVTVTLAKEHGWRAVPSGDYCPEHIRESLPRCEFCGECMRPTGERIQDWPDTKARGAHGMCHSCAYGRRDKYEGDLRRAEERYWNVRGQGWK